MRYKISFLFFNISLIFTPAIYAQKPIKPSAVDIYQSIQKLKVCGNVLYLAAHPDDENTNLITVLAKERLLNVTYLSLTRGDGGQNLIGNEQGDKLGIIRTQELLEARKIDGGMQEFSRARDFGFSKNPDETFQKWEKEKVLFDVVYAIRRLKPDIIITRFSLEPGKTHGHHTASALLAVEAAQKASDPSYFPEQLNSASVWSVKRVVWNSSKWFYSDESKLMERKPITMDCGLYNPLIGKSYNEIAAESRSMHKSQGFGTMGTRGSNIEYFEHLWGDKANNDIFEKLDFSTKRFSMDNNINTLVDKILAQFQPHAPHTSIPDLIELHKIFIQQNHSFWKEKKLQELKLIIKNCLGLYLEVFTKEPNACTGDSINVTLEAINRSSLRVKLISIKLPYKNDTNTLATDLIFNKTSVNNFSITIPPTATNSHPYWLSNSGTSSMYDYNFQMNQHPENTSLQAELAVQIEQHLFYYHLPIVFKKSDPVQGEVYKSFEIWNPLFINLSNDLMIFPNEKSQQISVKLIAGQDNTSGTVNINAPKGWSIEPKALKYDFTTKLQEENFTLSITPNKEAENGVLEFSSKINNKLYNQAYQTLQHPHISSQVFFPQSSVKLVKSEIKISSKPLAYIDGAGDDVSKCLSKVGYNIDLLNPNQIKIEQLQKYEAIIIGIRAFNTIENIKLLTPLLFQYAKNGGTLICQYNTNSKLYSDSFLPFKIKLSNDRVTQEDAPISILNPKHVLLNFPNKIGTKDFENWVQERGLYFASEWDTKFETILSCNDSNESPKNSGILYATFDKGVVIYTSLSFFRQLPAGVEGAYRLFANMISAKAHQK